MNNKEDTGISSNIDLTKLSTEEFTQLVKAVNIESRNRKNDYSGYLPVVTISNNRQTLWYENFVDGIKS